MIHAVGHARDPLARHLDERGADVDAAHVVAEAREVFAEPAGAAAHVEHARAGRERERDGHVGEVAEVAVRVFVQPVVPVLRGLVREVVEGLRPQVVAALLAQPAEVLARRALVVHALDLRRPTLRVARRRFARYRFAFAARVRESEMPVAVRVLVVARGVRRRRGRREQCDLGGDRAHELFVGGARAESRQLGGDAADEAATRAARDHFADEGEVGVGASFDVVFGEHVAARVGADASAQGGVFDEAVEVGFEHRVGVAVEVDLDDRVVGQLRVPADVRDDGGDARGHDAAEARAGLADGALADVDGDVGLRDAPLELGERDVARDRDAPGEAALADEPGHVEVRVGRADERVAEAAARGQRGERAQRALDALAGSDEAERRNRDFAFGLFGFVNRASRGGRAAASGLTGMLMRATGTPGATSRSARGSTPSGR